MRNLDLNVENMERRMMMAGDVSVRVAGGDLIVNGDRQGNDVVIHGTSEVGTFVVEGINDTTINGQESVEFSGVTDDMRINLRSGDNALVLTRTPMSETGFSTSQGPTATRSAFSVADDLVIRTGSGNDIVLIGDLVKVGDDLSISTGGGDDAAIAYQAQIEGRARFTTGSGDDVIGLSVTEIGDDLSALAGAGDDLIVGWYYQVDGDSRISAGGGDDQLYLTDEVVSGNETVLGGGGNDVLTHMRNGFESVAGTFRTTSVETQTELGFVDWITAAGDAFEQHDRFAEADQLREDYLQ